MTDQELKIFLSRYNDMTVGEFRKLEKLRGCPIELITEDFADIPCEEINSPEVMAVQPVVSVHMITYNHEKYIAEAIEGVVRQECSFPIELIIGEDCSTDRTREICLEYQKKYPHIIRLLISEKNVGGNRNSLRCANRCRGKYIAYCEGDDYWTDMSKLQKQVDFLEKNSDINLVSSNYCGKIEIEDRYIHNRIPVTGLLNYFSENCNFPWMPCQTAGLLIKTVSVLSLKRRAIFYFNLWCGDIKLFFHSVSENGRYYIFPEEMYVKRDQPAGVSLSSGKNMVCIDVYLIACYFWKRFDKRYDTDDFYYSVFVKAFTYRLLHQLTLSEKKLSDHHFREILPVLDFCRENRSSKTLKFLRHGLLGLWQNPNLRNYTYYLCREMTKRKLKIYDENNQLVWRILNSFCSNIFCFRLQIFEKFLYHLIK